MNDTPPFDYATFVTRNQGYVSAATQERIARTRLGIMGCGIGSSVAVCAARMGFQHFVLVDGDTVDAHNLNRQFYDFADIGRAKVDALRAQILRINPHAQVDAHACYLTRDNVATLVGAVDMVFDTIDFLDLNAILTLHGTARALERPIMTALSIGYGAGVLYFPAHGGPGLVDILEQDLQRAQAEGDAGYAAVFSKVMQRIGAHLDAQVVEQVRKALTIMEDGRPCPASQVSVGSFTIAAMAVTMMHDLLAGLPVAHAPHMVVHSFRQQTTRLIDISRDA